MGLPCSGFDETVIQMMAINANRYLSHEQTFTLQARPILYPNPEAMAPLGPDYQIHLKAALLAASDCFKGAVAQKPALNSYGGKLSTENLMLLNYGVREDS